MNPQAGVCLALALLAGCSQPGSGSSGPPVTATTTVFNERTIVRAPSGSISLRFEDGAVTLSAGFMRQSPVATVESPSSVSWAPDSRRFFINESGGASRNRFRLWTVDARAQATESPAIHDAAVAELGRLNGCDSVPEPDAATRGMGWSPDGDRVYVLAEVRRQTGSCVWTGVDDILVVAEAATGRLLEVARDAEARRLYPTLPWAPVTEP